MKTTLCIASLLSLSNGAHLRATNSLVSSTTTTTAQGGHSVFPGSTRFVNKNPVCVEDTATTMDGISTVTLKPWQKRLGVQCCEAGVWTGDETKDYPSWKVSRPGCLKEKTYAEADAHCKSVDKQLCQISQLTNDNARGKGCAFDKTFVWTQTVCTDDSTSASAADAANSATDTDDADSQSTAAIPPGNDLLTKTVDAIADTTSTRIKSLETKMEKMTTALYIETEDRLDTAETTIQELKTSKSKAETANAALKTELSLLKSAVSGIEKGEPGKDGPKGDQGEPGAPGAAGPVGAVGPPGKDGANGEKGADGVASESLKQTVAALRLEHDECSSNPCQNGATCIDGNSAYTCNCEPGYDGVNCENNIDECADQTCSDHGTCVDGIGIHECLCAAGYEGANCENDVDECKSAPCQNGGTCTDGENFHTCACLPGTSGPNCEIRTTFTFGAEESTTLTSYQVFTAQEDGEINIEAYGAGGKRGFPAGTKGEWPAGGSGGFAKGSLLVKKGESFAIFVGGAGKGYGTTNDARAGGGLVGVFGPFSTETPGIEQIVSDGGSDGLNAVLIAGSGGGGGNCGGTFENRNGGYGGGEKAGNGRNSGPGGSNPCGTSCNARTPAEGHSGFKGDAAGGNGGGGGAGWWPGKAGGGNYGAGGGSGYARSDVMNPLIYASKGSKENEDGKVVIKFSAKQKSSCKATFRKTAGKPNAKSCDIEHLEPLKFNGLYETYGGDCAKQCESFGSDCDAYAEKNSGSSSLSFMNGKPRECQLYKQKDEWSSDKSLCAEEASQQWNGFYQRQCPIFEHRYESQTNANEPHTFTATVNGDIKFKLWGAGGMPGAKCKGCADCPDRCSDRGVEADVWAGGRGGYTQGVVKDVKVGDTFTIFVGGPGQGYGTTTSFGSGGGLVAVFRNNDHLAVDELIAQPERALLVAGSGGGSVNGHYGEGHSGGGGRRGGGFKGEDATGCGSWGGCSSWNGGTSATQTTGHKQFQGRPAGTNGCQAGGGAGWWGGTGTNGNGFNSCNAGSGGSGYIDSDVVDAFMFGAMDSTSTTEDIDWNEAGHGASKYTNAKKSEGLVLAVGI